MPIDCDIESKIQAQKELKIIVFFTLNCNKYSSLPPCHTQQLKGLNYCKYQIIRTKENHSLFHHFTLNTLTLIISMKFWKGKNLRFFSTTWFTKSGPIWDRKYCWSAATIELNLIVTYSKDIDFLLYPYEIEKMTFFLSLS